METFSRHLPRSSRIQREWVEVLLPGLHTLGSDPAGIFAAWGTLVAYDKPECAVPKALREVTFPGHASQEVNERLRQSVSILQPTYGQVTPVGGLPGESHVEDVAERERLKKARICSATPQAVANERQRIFVRNLQKR